jgi:hypothetical protein
MISTRLVELVIDTVVCLTLAKWETVSGQFGGYLRLRVTALALGCFVVGLWSGWFLRGSDGSRAEKRKELGTEMIFLAHQIADIRHPMHLARPRIRSCFATTKKLGLWVPDDRVFQLPVPVAYQEVSNYLRQVGRMLKDGNFREARQDAKKSKAAFEAAFARLPSR